MATPQEFAQRCQQASKALRRMPADLRRTMAAEAKEKVAVPLAGAIARAATGPYARVLAAGTKARKAADPKVVVGGMRPRLRGGAGPRDLIWGTEFGGGKKVSNVAPSRRRGRYRRRTTTQFMPANPFVYKTVTNSMDWVLDAYADIVLAVLDEGMPDG